MSDFNNQELQIPTNNNNLEDESVDFTLLRLDSSTNHHQHHTPCTTCGCSGFSSANKRTSPELNNPQDQLKKKPKKLFLEPSETTTTTNNIPNSLHGNVSKISQSHCDTDPVLRRCVSDPCSPPAKVNSILQSPESSKKGSVSLPPRPPYRRSVSDPSPNKSHSRSSSSNESSSFKWLKKMRDSVKEINQWWDEIMPDVDEVPEPCNFEEDEKLRTEENTRNATDKYDSVKDCEESVCVERNGECIIIHFRCPCSKRYQILLSGGNCYYKLM